VLQSALKEGFQAQPIRDFMTLKIEYPNDGNGNLKDINKRHRLEAHLNEWLSRTGLGHCDGSSFEPDGIKIFCLVVDYDLAQQIITSNLAPTEFSGYTRIYQSYDDLQ